MDERGKDRPIKNAWDGITKSALKQNESGHHPQQLSHPDITGCLSSACSSSLNSIFPAARASPTSFGGGLLNEAATKA